MTMERASHTPLHVRLSRIPTRWMLIGVLLVAAGLRLWNLDQPRMTADESAHYFREMQLIHTVDFQRQRIHPVDMYHGTSPGPSGHPLFAIQVTNLVMGVFPDTPTTARGVQALAGVAMVGVIFLVGKDLFGEREAIVAAAMAAALPLAIRYNRTLYLDSIYSLLTTLVAWATFRAFRSDHLAWAMVAGLCLGLAGATKTSAPLLLCFVLAYALFVWRRSCRARREAERRAAEALEQAKRRRKGRRRRRRLERRTASRASPHPRQSFPPTVKLGLVFIIALIVFWADVSPVAYWEAIRNPVDTGYQHPALDYFSALWQARGWLVGVLTFLWTPLVLLAAMAVPVLHAIDRRQMSGPEVLLALWLICLSPLVLLHLRGISGEHGHLPLVAPVCLLASSSIVRLRGRRLTVA